MIIKANYIDYSNNISLAGGIDLSTGKEFYSIYARFHNLPISQYFNNYQQALAAYYEIENQFTK